MISSAREGFLNFPKTLGACLLLTLPSVGAAQALQLRDIQTNHTAQSSSNPSWLTNAGTLTFFTATTANDGTELWATDGTIPNTQMVRDIQPGAVGSNPILLTRVGSQVYFCTSSWGTGCPLWKSDGTFAGTRLVADIANGALAIGIASVPFVSNGSLVFFVANDGIHGNELWKSDIVAGTTAQVMDINPGSADSNPNQLTVLNGVLYFAATDGAHGIQLWKSDGTPGGTSRVTTINSPSGSSLTGLMAATGVSGGRLFFAANDGLNVQPWSSDGTPSGTHELLVPPDTDTDPVDFVESGSLVYFNAVDNGQLAFGNQLYSTNGITVTDLPYGGTRGIGAESAGDPHWLTDLNGQLVFTATNENVQTVGLGIEPFYLPGGTVTPLKDIWPGGSSPSQPNSSIDYSSGPQGMTVVSSEGLAYFAATNGTGRELWATDGTPAGTVLVKQIGPPATDPLSQSVMVSGGSYLLFTANDSAHGQELWRSNGTGAGTFLLRDIAAGDGSSIDPLKPGFKWSVIGSQVYFPADDGTDGIQLWKSDGSLAGTQMVAAIGSSPNDALANSVYATDGNTLYFTAFDSVHGLETWQTDGAGPNTQLVSDIAPGAASSNPCELQAVGANVFFNPDDGAHGHELWSITASGAALIDDINPSAGSFPQHLTPLGTSVLFSADDGISGRELWSSDGTLSGTHRVADLNAGAGSSSPENFMAVGNELFFSANGTELWKTDGSGAGTVRVSAISGGAGARIPSDLISDGGACYTLSPTFRRLGNTLFFVADDGVHGLELWANNLLDGGTGMVADILPGATGSAPEALITLNNTLFFTADDGTHGRELWKSDGTAAGTTLVSDINPGSGSALIQYPTAVGNRLYFAAYEPSHGVELWRTDGTDAGTVLVGDIAPGPSSSSPGPFQVTPGHLYFPATDATSDREPWVLAVDTTPPAVSHQVSGPDGGNGWYVGNVAVSFLIVDPLSPIDSDAGCGPALVSTDTAGLTFTCIAEAAGGTTTDSVIIKRDTAPPAINCPANATVEATSSAGGVAQYPSVTANDALDPTPVIVFSTPPGTALPFGVTQVTAVAQDAAGNTSARCTFALTVRDTTPPIPTCPKDVYSESSGANGSVVTYPAASAFDAVDPSPSISYDHPSGSRFPNGVTVVTVTATDASGNSATCAFDVLIGCTSVSTCQTARKSEYAFGCNAVEADPLIWVAGLTALAMLRSIRRKGRR